MRSVKGERRSRLLMSALVVGLDVHKGSFYAMFWTKMEK